MTGRNLAVDPLLEGIPTGWRTARFKGALRERARRNSDGSAVLMSLTSAGEVTPRSAGADRQQPSPDSIPRYLLVEPGSLVINPMWLTGGAVGVASVSGAVSPDYRVFECTPDILPRFVHHVLRSAPYRDQYQLFVRADTTFDRRVKQEDIDNLRLPVPPLDAQRQISDFLDDQVARIDEVIGLREQQVSAVSEAHTSWLSAQYEALSEAYGSGPLRYGLNGIRQGWSPQCEDRTPEPGEWGVLKAGCVNGGLWRPEQVKTLPSGVEPRRELAVRSGDFLVNRASGSLDLIGSGAVVDGDPPMLLLCDKVYRVDLRRETFLPKYVSLLWRARQVREAIRLGVSGAEGMANSLPSSVLREMLLPYAPVTEQRRWVAVASEREHDVREVVRLMGEQVSLLQERKRSLITAAVTGEMDVTTATSGVA